MTVVCSARILNFDIPDTKNRLKYLFQSVFNAVPALHFRDDKVSIAKIRLVPITVSQLKCALHILIGDWYETAYAADDRDERVCTHFVVPARGRMYTPYGEMLPTAWKGIEYYG